MDKANRTAREHIAGLADLVGAVRLPEGGMRATAGTDVVVDLLVFLRRAEGETPGGAAWIELAPVSSGGRGRRRGLGTVIEVNRYFAEHPEMVLGVHALKRGIYGPALAYTCRPRQDGVGLEAQLPPRSTGCPPSIFDPPAESDLDAISDDECRRLPSAPPPRAPRSRKAPYLIGDDEPADADRGRRARARRDQMRARAPSGISPATRKIIRALLPIRDAVRDVLRAQAADQPWAGGAGPAPHRLRQLRARLRADQPHRRLGHDRRRRPARSAKRIAGRTSRPSPTIPIAGWSPASRIMTSKAASPAWGRSSASG